MNDKLAAMYRDSQRELYAENENLRVAIGDFLAKFLPWEAEQSKAVRQSISWAMRGELDYLIDCHNQGQDCQ